MASPDNAQDEPAGTLRVPARVIPAPTSISHQAQMVLAIDLPANDDGYPALDDIEAWRLLVAERDAVTIPVLQGFAAGVDVRCQRITIAEVPVDCAVPPDAARDDRVVLDMHGGGLIMLGGDGCSAAATLSAAHTGLPTWGPDYRMAPDHPHPAPLDDCIAVYRALLAERPADRVVVSGTSAGGNLAAALVVRALEEGLDRPAALVLHTPEVDLTESGDSFRTNLGLDPLLRSLMPINLLHSGGADLAHPHLSPLFADLSGFPPTVLTTGTRDLFLSNTVLMHRALRRAGVDAELHVLEAAPHAGFFWLSPEERELGDDVRAFIDRHCPPSS